MEDLFEVNNDEFKPTLLLVDDEINILKSIRRTLRSVNVNVLMAESGKDALKQLKEHPIDLILSDMRMPEMSGAEFLSEAATTYPNIPRILMTGYSDMDSTIKAINEGRISNYLPKPWDDDHLKSVIADALQSTQLKIHNEYLTQQLVEKKAQLEAINQNLEKAVDERTEELNQSHHSMISLVASIVALRDEQGSKTAELKGNIVKRLAEALGLSDKLIEAIHNATLLSNVGKMAFKDKTLDKPYNTLTAVELKTFRKFPLLGEASLLGIPQLKNEASIIRSQFERHNGGGFPDGLAGDNVPIGARILSVVRDYIELMQGRYTGTAFEPAKAKSEIQKFSGERYDPSVVEAFISIVDDYTFNDVADDEKRISAQALRSGMILSRNIYSCSGVILLKKSCPMTEALIEKITNFEHQTEEILDIYVRI